MSRHSMRQSATTDREEHGSSCETCGRAFEVPIQLTNLSASPTEIYNACPFCFSKQSEISEAPLDLKGPTVKEPAEVPKTRQKDVKTPEPGTCPHFVGYLKKRPKNSPIPESCLTCTQMIQCLL